ncbi:alpha/beta hydrolase family protein [Deinococcus peraridilitoris]|uniref:Dienelactone hydrolase family protein n=1 Tax=Deinococcus peraridilitoris (strain DSM 19664 / LMG 22246 / CIP 109416 / KR-200) TaxID=937777 RepID=L0A432_DEIPD|nr:alpha/beta fold hydrolase [Deinococcus peraridilitoris]AFZ67957.1 Dienelactone hydrolase family protein [Deinococcus peraridilitoris DSM 19664]
MPAQLLLQTDHEHEVAGGRRVSVTFGATRTEIPGVLLLPASGTPTAGVLLLHGYSSHKEAMSETVGQALLRRQIASLAIDLPLHGARADPLRLYSLRQPQEVMGVWRQALRDATLGLRLLQEQPDIRAPHLAVMGYSLGSFLALMLAARESQVSSVVLAAGGDLPLGTPLTPIARMVADPLRAVRRLAGRPLLMVSGRHDRTVRPEQAERLYAAAREPKELRWYDVGHILPPVAVEEAAAWLRRQLPERVEE